MVIDKLRDVDRTVRGTGVGAENLEKMAEPFPLGLETEFLVRRQRLVIGHGVIVEGDGIKAKIGPQSGGALFGGTVDMAAHRVIERSGREGTVG